MLLQFKTGVIIKIPLKYSAAYYKDTIDWAHSQFLSE